MSIFKKMILLFGSLLTFSMPAFADHDFDIIGQITAVHPEGITLNSMGKSIDIAVTPITEIEVERKGFFEYDYHISLSQVQVGDWAKVEVIPAGPNQYMAKDIEIVRR